MSNSNQLLVNKLKKILKCEDDSIIINRESEKKILISVNNIIKNCDTVFKSFNNFYEPNSIIVFNGFFIKTQNNGLINFKKALYFNSFFDFIIIINSNFSNLLNTCLFIEKNSFLNNTNEIYAVYEQSNVVLLDKDTNSIENNDNYSYLNDQKILHIPSNGYIKLNTETDTGDFSILIILEFDLINIYNNIYKNNLLESNIILFYGNIFQNVYPILIKISKQKIMCLECIIGDVDKDDYDLFYIPITSTLACIVDILKTDSFLQFINVTLFNKNENDLIKFYSTKKNLFLNEKSLMFSGQIGLGKIVNSNDDSIDSTNKNNINFNLINISIHKNYDCSFKTLQQLFYYNALFLNKFYTVKFYLCFNSSNNNSIVLKMAIYNSNVLFNKNISNSYYEEIIETKSFENKLFIELNKVLYLKFNFTNYISIDNKLFVQYPFSFLYSIFFDKETINSNNILEIVDENNEVFFSTKLLEENLLYFDNFFFNNNLVYKRLNISNKCKYMITLKKIDIFKNKKLLNIKILYIDFEQQKSFLLFQHNINHVNIKYIKINNNNLFYLEKFEMFTFELV